MDTPYPRLDLDAFWQSLLLYDLTGTYFGVDANGPVTEASDPKAFGYSRDKLRDCLHVTLEQYHKRAATGLSSRSVLGRMSEIQMLDVTIPTTAGRESRDNL